MKISIRFIFAAVLVASIAALGFSHGAWAKPAAAGTVPACPISDTRYNRGGLKTCSSVDNVAGVPRGGSATVTEIDLTPYGLVPGSSNFGPGVNVVILDSNGKPVPVALVQICFPDPTGVGNIFHWMSGADWRTYYKGGGAGRWVFWPTYHNKAAGLTCTLTWLTGVYTIEY